MNHKIEEIIHECSECTDEYIALKWNDRLVTTGLCFTCSDIAVEKFQIQEKRNRMNERIMNFSRFCPPMYLTINVNSLPRPDCYQKVMSGANHRRGLIIIGSSRLGKTRSAYALLKKLYLDEEKSCFAITELQLSHEMSKFGKSEATLSLLDRMCSVDYLLIDDLGKSVMTQRVVAELYYVIEERISHHKQTIVTMQMSASDFAAKMAQSSGQDMAEAIMKRLRESCDIIEFK